MIDYKIICSEFMFFFVHDQKKIESEEPEAKLLDITWTKVFRVFLLAIHSYLY
jgi:hypothetical protein